MLLGLALLLGALHKLVVGVDGAQRGGGGGSRNADKLKAQAMKALEEAQPAAQDVSVKLTQAINFNPSEVE